MIPSDIILPTKKNLAHLKMSNLVRKDSLNPTGTEEWKRALDWLLEIGIIPSNNPLAAPDCDVIKFAQAISDGVILCELVNLLRPNTIETITYNTCLNNACLSNVSAFLEALSDYFDISEDVAFDPHDLVGFENFGYFLRVSLHNIYMIEQFRF